MAARVAIVFLVTGMLVTGISNSLLQKAQDLVCVHNCDDPDPSKRRDFQQPVLQTAIMFVGEALCLIVLFAVNRERPRPPAAGGPKLPNTDGPSPNSSAIVLAIMGEDGEQHDKRIEGRRSFLFLGPAAFDIIGTTLMNVGLLFVPVSVYQMTRGALVLFVGLFSVIFLHRSLSGSQWAALTTVMLGVAIVGLSGALRPTQPAGDIEPALFADAPDPGKVALGIGIILVAQTFTASQFVTEEKIMMRYSCEPLRAVGLEGVFGLSLTLLIMLVAHLLVGRTDAGRGGVFDAYNGIHEVIDNKAVWGIGIATAASIGLFNMFGMAVTRSVSAAARSTIDTSRTIGIWAVSLALGWEEFQFLQVIGFVLVAYGTAVFNDILAFPSMHYGGPAYTIVHPDVPGVHVHDEDNDSLDEADLSRYAHSTSADAHADGSGSSRPRARRTPSVAANERDRQRNSREASPLLADPRRAKPS